MNLSEAEIQVLASIQEAVSNDQVTSRETLEKRSDRFWVFKTDWSSAFADLESKNLISGDEAGYELTETGRPLALDYFAERPDLYWYYYQQFYDLASSSKAHSRFCETLYGEDRCQEGQADMECFDDLLSRLQLKPEHHLLDLGCGAGGLSEYVYDKYDAIATGIDYSESAIQVALERTQGKREKLHYLQADLNALELPDHTYDVAISIDSIYWVADLGKTIPSIIKAIKPGGQLCILIEHRLNDSADTDSLDSKDTWVAKSIDSLGLTYDTIDYSEMFLKFWPRAHEAARALREEYVSEGTELICDNWIRVAEQDYLPSVEAGLIKRYLYQIQL
jgi:cyclopropane fatty-acyl-phospholipid synthase-like methyltransferase